MAHFVDIVDGGIIGINKDEATVLLVEWHKNCPNIGTIGAIIYKSTAELPTKLPSPYRVTLCSR